jgi:hypothetical protein
MGVMVLVVETLTQKQTEQNKYEIEKPEHLELMIKPNKRLLEWFQTESEKKIDEKELECPTASP